jgi:Replication initiator protein, pSAM2
VTTTTLDAARMTRAQRAALPLTTEVAQAVAEEHGVCVRPLAMRRIDTTGRVDVVPVPCGSTREDQCRPCADKARRLRMVQCCQGWPLETEPVTERATPTEEQKQLLAVRADLVTVYTECREIGDEATCEQIAEAVAGTRHRTPLPRSPRPTHPAGPATQAGQALHPATPGHTGPAPPTRRETDRGASVRRSVPALHLPHADLGQLRAGGQTRHRNRSNPV